MNRDRLHALVKAAAHNAYGMRKSAEARKAYAKAVVKTAAVHALRKQDLKGAILARVNNEKIALKLPGGFGKRIGTLLSRAGTGLSRTGKRFNRLGVLGAARLYGRNALRGLVGHELAGTNVNGLLDYAKSGFRGFGQNFMGSRYKSYLENLGVKPEEVSALLARGKGLLGAPGKIPGQERDIAALKEMLKSEGPGGGLTRRLTAGSDTAARIAARLKQDMWRARRNAAIAAGGGALGLGYMHDPGADYDPYRY